MNHSFGTGEAFTVGVEEELLLVDRESFQLAHVADELLPRIALPQERAGHEAFQAEIEVRSEPRRSGAEAVADIAEGRAAIRAAGGTPMAVGLHPDARFGDVRLVESDRYRRVEGEMRGLIKRTPECAMHVHVAMPSPAVAVDALMGLREALPLIGALGAASPFWFGMDSGLASARSAVIRAYPGRGLPPPLRGWEDYLETLEGITLGGGPEDHTMVWWDARLQPRLGTVELRELDVQTGLEEAAGMAALVHAVARRAAEQPPRELAPAQALHWSSFRAVRDGLDAELLFRGRRRPARDAARELLDELRGEDDALEGVERILRDGDAPARQRQIHAQGGMPALLRHLSERTALGTEAHSGRPRQMPRPAE
ncbi:MAG: glutamate---cysteine ligase / carboxylate-amine ligase [Thermoleophilaceae bacterium]|nr:glutamate---cysteine ligase / carboxylate-amine ligase [Thermoleophilaceae bacterium]